jgi:hypothetical protein
MSGGSKHRFIPNHLDHGAIAMANPFLSKSPSDFYRSVVLLHDKDECLVWPFGFSGNGYPALWADGRMKSVHRMICAETHGAPDVAMDAAHSCGNKACVSRRHLSWKSRAGNEADKIAHKTTNRGTKHGMAQLSDDEVRAIRSIGNTKSQRQIARDFGISQTAVWEILTRKKWTSLA